ncbi:MAG: glycoside hydrolase family 25 protein [Lachnospiraceae bacterium]|nr:glycoside hydrolase family 25 protein [Lachnospiraceae bacterium]
MAILCVASIVVIANWQALFGQKSEPAGTTKQENVESALSPEGQIGDDLKGFLHDDTFFDKDENSYDWNSLYNSNKLSMIVTSIEKDLRIQVVDLFGELVTDESFYVTVEDVGEYKDLDKDGIIYIADLKAGEYKVSLNEIEGYSVPANSTKIRVKERVEYVAIDDISLLIKTEDEIDVKKEDTRENSAREDADNTEIQKQHTTDSTQQFGIDVSKWQGNIDWDKVKASGVEFAMIRAGYRGSQTGALVEDPNFLVNIRGAKRAGLKVGVYFFTQAVNEVEAVEEASMVIALCDGYELDYPVVIDSEGAGGDGRADSLDTETRTKVCAAFCETIDNAGYEPGVYASRSWYNANLDVKKLDKYRIWLAEYRSTPLYSGYYDMWQYTSKGKVDGIEGNVDLNISYMSK